MPLTIVTIVICFLLIAALIVWQRKIIPAATGSNHLDKQLTEATEQLKAANAKLSERDAELRANSAEIAGLKATNAALGPQLSDEKTKTATLQAQLATANESLAKAASAQSAAETNIIGLRKSEAVVVAQLAALETKHTHLRTERDALSVRAVSAEATTAALQEEIRNRDNAIETMRLQQTKVRDELTKSLDESRVEQNRFLGRAVSAEQKVEGLVEELQSHRKTIANLQAELGQTRAELAASLAKQQADTDAASRFENIGQEILKATLEEAKKGVIEINATMQKSSAEDLDKHAKALELTLAPLQEKLKTYDETIDKFRLDSQKVYGGLSNQLQELQLAERDLHKQAQALTNALSAAPKVRGMYGEIILRQLVEFAGMQDRCHFEEQVSTLTAEGRKIPDMIVSLPGGQKVIIDAKATMNACVEAFEAEDEVQRKLLLKRHCENVRSRINELSAKNYFADHANSVEAVFLFLPAENLYATAMENDADLTQYALERNIIVCGPNALILLLKVANQVWQRASIEEDAKKIADRANEIYKHAYNFVAKFVTIGDRIKQLGATYNDAAGTLDSRLIPSGRKMQEFEGVKADKELPELGYYVEDIRPMQSKEAKEIQKLSSKIAPVPEDAELVLSAGS